MVLIEQREARGTISNFQRAIFNTRSLEFGCRSMHLFDGLAWHVVWRSSGFE